MLYHLTFEQTWTDEDEDDAREYIARAMDDWLEAGGCPGALVKAMSDTLEDIAEAAGSPVQ